MKYLLSVLSICLLAGSTFAQAPSCCEPVASTDPNAVFAAYGAQTEFRSSHESPTDFVLENPAGKDITFSTPDGKTGGAYYLEGAEKSKNYLIVIHEWWGLNDHIKREAERWQKKLGGDIHVLALDLYDGEVGTTREEASALMKACKKERAEAIIDGALKFAGKKADIYTIGWCFGGGWSMQTSLRAGKQAEGCVIYYGQPETDVERLKKLRTEVLMVWPTRDKWINEELVSKFKASMKAAKKDLTVKAYDADHAFANPTGSRYNATAAQSANKEALQFFQARMKK